MTEKSSQVGDGTFVGWIGMRLEEKKEEEEEKETNNSASVDHVMSVLVSMGAIIETDSDS